jgi:hypothetical protein
MSDEGCCGIVFDILNIGWIILMNFNKLIMSKTKKPKSELNQLEARLLYKETVATIFTDWSCDELNKLSDMSLNLQFDYGEIITKRNETVDWFGILLKGTLLLSIENEKIGLINPVNFIGYMAVLRPRMECLHTFDITGMTQGVLSVFYVDELLNINKTAPTLALKFIETLGKIAADVIYNQFFGGNLQETNIINYIEYSNRRIQEFINMHPVFNSHKELDKLDIRILASVFKVIHFRENLLITKMGTIENSVFFLVEGKIGVYERKIFEENVFGQENFLKPGLYWDRSVIGLSHGTILWMKRGDFNEMVKKFPSTSVKFLKIVTEVLSKDMINSKQKDFNLDALPGEIFLELNPENLITQPKPQEKPKESKEDIEKHPEPLYTFPIFETFAKTSPEPTKTPAKELDCLFLATKVSKQALENKSKKNPKERKKIMPVILTKEEIKQNQQTEIGLQLSDILKDLKSLEKENENLTEEIDKLTEENNMLEHDINGKNLVIERKSIE